MYWTVVVIALGLQPWLVLQPKNEYSHKTTRGRETTSSNYKTLPYHCLRTTHNVIQIPIVHYQAEH